MTAPQQAELDISSDAATFRALSHDIETWQKLVAEIKPTGKRPIDKQLQALRTGLTVAQLALEELTKND